MILHTIAKTVYIVLLCNACLLDTNSGMVAVICTEWHEVVFWLHGAVFFPLTYSSPIQFACECVEYFLWQGSFTCIVFLGSLMKYVELFPLGKDFLFV